MPISRRSAELGVKLKKVGEKNNTGVHDPEKVRNVPTKGGPCTVEVKCKVCNVMSIGEGLSYELAYRDAIRGLNSSSCRENRPPKHEL